MAESAKEPNQAPQNEAPDRESVQQELYCRKCGEVVYKCGGKDTAAIGREMVEMRKILKSKCGEPVGPHKPENPQPCQGAQYMHATKMRGRS